MYEDVEGPSVHDSILSNEFDMVQFRDSFEDITSFGRPQKRASRFGNSHDYSSKEAII